MRKIGKTIGKFCLLLLLPTFLFTEALAQDSVSVNATVSETTIYTGERVSFSVEISGSFNNVSRPELPQFNGFRLLSNNPSTSRSYSFVNGKSSTKYTYSYYLVAQKKGDYQIPPAAITIDGEEYKTDPISVKVIDRNESANSTGSDKPDIFLKLEASDSQPVTGQQIIIDVVLFFKSGLEVNSYQPVPGWKAEGFWKEELQNTGRPQATSTILDGIRYRRARLLQFSLFPTKSGELQISPYKIIVSVHSNQSRDDSFSSFFSGFGGSQRQVELSSDPVTVNVEELPQVSDGTYTGAVGDFDITRKISAQQAEVGESIELVTTFEGTGNIPLLSKPDYDLPDGLEIYEPQQNSNLNRRNNQISGTKTFSDVIVARAVGSYTIPGKKVSYYNPSKEEFVTTTLAPVSFEITKGADVAYSEDSGNSLSVKPITGLATWTTSASSQLEMSWWFWAGIILPLLILGIGYWRKSYLEKINGDQAFARSQQAVERATERLEEAISLAENNNIKQAYNMLQKALTGFISDRLNLPKAGLSNNEYLVALERQQVDKNLVKNVKMLLDKCESISYAPNTSAEYLKSHVGLAESTLNKLKKEL